MKSWQGQSWEIQPDLTSNYLPRETAVSYETIETISQRVVGQQSRHSTQYVARVATIASTTAAGGGVGRLEVGEIVPRHCQELQHGAHECILRTLIFVFYFWFFPVSGPWHQLSHISNHYPVNHNYTNYNVLRIITFEQIPSFFSLIFPNFSPVWREAPACFSWRALHHHFVFEDFSELLSSSSWVLAFSS